MYKYKYGAQLLDEERILSVWLGIGVVVYYPEEEEEFSWEPNGPQSPWGVGLDEET